MDWISVGDMMPGKRQRAVFCLDGDGGAFVGWWNGADFEVGTTKKVRYWMNVPDPPNA